MPDDVAGSDWTDAQVDLIVADYFDMLGLELRGAPFVKARRNAALQALTGRSRGSIEFKHQNISAALVWLGMPWIQGYKPMANFQRALIDGALRDARNRALGRQGEERIFFSEQASLRGAGRSDLAGKVRWVLAEDGDGAGYDIRSFDPAGRERLIEVKTTVGCNTTPFFLSENERAFSAERPDAFRLVRLYDFARQPRAFELTPPLDQCVMLRPATWRAEF